MTEELKALLEYFGGLSVTLEGLLSERPGAAHSSLEEYYKALGAPLPDEPVLVVRIGKDEQIRFLKEGQHDVEFRDDGGKKTGSVTVWELPEDEFWYLRAFRPALFNLSIDLPSFIYEMWIVNAYARFEVYLSDLIRARLWKHPRLLGSKREVSYDQIFAAASKDELVETMIEREIRDIMYLPFLGVMAKMREQLGFRCLTDEYHDRANHVSLLRNCFMHNRGNVDVKLARAKQGLRETEKLSMTIHDVEQSVYVLRKLAYETDKIFENLS